MNMPLVLLNRRRRGNVFTPSGLFALAEPGVWYDPSDVANLAWRRNLLTFTEQFDNAAWVKTAATITANAGAAPDGTTTADTIIPTTTNDFHYVGRAATVIAGTSYVVSFYAKNSGYGFVRYYDGVANNAVFNLSGSGSITDNSGGGGATITAVGNGWYRCTKVVVPASTSLNVFIYPQNVVGMVSYAGDGTSGILIWGAQLELGSTATAYQRITDVNTEVIERFPTATLYQDTAGTTPVTTPGQTVALALDKSKGLVLGPELVTNGDFSSATGWALDATATISGGTLNINNSSSIISAAQTFAIVAGRTYEFRATCTSFTSGSVVLGTKTGTVVSAFPINGTGTYRALVVAGAANDGIRLISQGAGFVGSIDNISVRELPGFHATQATAASRPTYGIVPATGRRNLLTRTEEFDNAVWVKAQTTVTANSATAPDGTLTADKILETAVTNAHGIYATFTYGAGLTYTATVYAKAAERSWVYLGADTSSTESVFFDLSGSGAVGSAGTGYTGTITSVGDGWFRCQVVFAQATALPPNFFVIGAATGNGTTSYAGNSSNGILIWGAQLETGSSATAYQRVGSAFDVTEAGVASLSYLSFDGVDDFLQTPTITPGIDKAQIFAGVRKLSDGSYPTIVEFSTNSDSTNGAFLLSTSRSSLLQDYYFQSRGTSLAATSSSAIAAPATNVITSIGDISGDRATLRVNSVQASQSTADQGTGNYLAYPLYIGRRGGTTAPFNGQLYSLLVRFGANLDAGTITSTETWVAGKTGVTL